MSDLISREDALNCFHDWIDQRGDVHTADEMPEYQRIEQLPSAQPDACENTCDFARKSNDMISRRDAIDAHCELCGDRDKCTYDICPDVEVFQQLPSAQPETAKRIVGKSRDGMTLWYQCDMCNEPVDAQDGFCRGCGRRLTDE